MILWLQPSPKFSQSGYERMESRLTALIGVLSALLVCGDVNLLIDVRSVYRSIFNTWCVVEEILQRSVVAVGLTGLLCRCCKAAREFGDLLLGETTTYQADWTTSKGRVRVAPRMLQVTDKKGPPLWEPQVLDEGAEKKF